MLLNCIQGIKVYESQDIKDLAFDPIKAQNITNVNDL